MVNVISSQALQLNTLVLLFLAIFSAPLLADKTVLVIESYHHEHPWDASYLQGIRDSLGDSHQIKTFEMDTKRLPESLHQAQANKAWQYFQSVRPDLVILGDDNALQYLGKKISDTGTPSVYLGINSNPRDLGLYQQSNLTGVLERPLFKRNVYEINKLMGGKLDSVLILLDDSPTVQAAVKESFKSELDFKVSGTQVSLKSIGQWQHWQQTVQTAAEHYDAIVIGLYHTIVDANGEHVAADNVLSWTSQNSPIPVFSSWSFAVGEGKAIGGLVLFGRWHGLEAGAIAKQILGGEDIVNIRPRASKKGRFYFSHSELARWGITLPPDIADRASFVD